MNGINDTDQPRYKDSPALDDSVFAALLHRLMHGNEIMLSTEEALARIADGDWIETEFQCKENTGITSCRRIDRADFINRVAMQPPTFYEGGAKAQATDFGVYVHFTSHDEGPGLLFFQTKPECRLTEQQLAESIKRGFGASIFSKC